MVNCCPNSFHAVITGNSKPNLRLLNGILMLKYNIINAIQHQVYTLDKDILKSIFASLNTENVTNETTSLLLRPERCGFKSNQKWM